MGASNIPFPKLRPAREKRPTALSELPIFVFRSGYIQKVRVVQWVPYWTESISRLYEYIGDWELKIATRMYHDEHEYILDILSHFVKYAYSPSRD